jgi:hypothetical protein
MDGQYMVGVYGDRTTSFSLLVSSYGQIVNTLVSGHPISSTASLSSPKYFAYKYTQHGPGEKNECKIVVQPEAGVGFVAITAVPDNSNVDANLPTITHSMWNSATSKD